MKLKHNKKRNTAFLFETIVREITRAAIRKDAKSSAVCKQILKEHFSSGTVLYKELKLYRAICDTHGLTRHSAEKLVSEVYESYKKMISDEETAKNIFSEQSKVIKKINKSVSKNAFSNFVPQYKNLATVYQIFNGELPPEKRVLLEETVCEHLTSERVDKVSSSVLPNVDNLIMKNFIKKFNDRYSGTLQEEQSRLLNKYILSFSDNGLALNAYLHEEIERLRGAVKSSLQMTEIKEDTGMVESTNKVLGILNNCSENKIDTIMLERLLKIQQLVKEIQV